MSLYQVPKLHFCYKWPSLQSANSLLIYDKILERKAQKWIRRFDLRYAVQAGEDLKDLKKFPLHIQSILKILGGSASSKLQIVVLGGGSVGDFGGFVASVLKRGVKLIHVPSTWLAAVDSAHGGKTALNVGVFKNQIGSFYSASEIYMIEEVLKSQPSTRAAESSGEVLKMALIQGGSIWHKVRNLPTLTPEVMWNILPALVKAKYKIVKQDPLEKKGLRYVLNLGHSMGHVYEPLLGLPHGEAVGFGLLFSLQWSFHKGYCSEQEYKSILSAPLFRYFQTHPHYKKCLSLSSKAIEPLLKQDKKKSTHNHLQFVFLKSVGKVFVEPVKIQEILKEHSLQWN